ncbi:MAG TPA: alpha-hydroxy-acid oxidizing protein [Nitrososphaerales archaeon]|nr:alpha-hydroxy-acid oxidizing protein [Nitrososphaerales archaeon]
MTQEYEKKESEPVERSQIECIDDFERAAREALSPENVEYVFLGTESEITLKRNVSAYSKYALRRRVLQDIDEVDFSTSYFDGRISSELPFFPGPVNVGPFYPGALLDELKAAQRFSIPFFISHLSIVRPLEVSSIPGLVKRKSGSSLIWQIYLQTQNVDLCYKQARQAKSWGYKALALTVDCELSVKLRNKMPSLIGDNSFVKVTPREVRKFSECTSLPLIIKGVMTPEDAEIAIESGAEGIVVSNHGGRTLDHGQATLDVLPEIVRHLKSKKKTRSAEIFFDGGIRRGTNILMALALGARACLMGRATLWAVAAERGEGVEHAITLLKAELERAALLCGVAKISNVPQNILRPYS